MLNLFNNRGIDGVEIAPMRENPFGEPVGYLETDIKSIHRPDADKFIFVKSNLSAKKDGGNPLAFSEKNENHPDGFAFIAGLEPIRVALTKAVCEALGDGLIVEASETEFNQFAARRLEESRLALAAQKNEARRKFKQLVGNENGFEAAWNESARATEALKAVMEAV
jgi:hypothetical protein